MAGPTLVATYSSSYSTTAAKSVSVTSQAGDLIVVYGSGEDFTDTLNTPSGNGITFTQQQAIGGPSTTDFCTAYIWSGVDNTGGTNWTLSVSNNDVDRYGITAYVFRNHNGVGASTKKNVDGAAPSMPLTTTADNSAIVVLDADWNADNGVGHSWTTINGTTPTSGNGLEVNFTFVSGAYTTYGAIYPDAGTAGSKTIGLDNSQKYAMVAIEVLAAVAPPPAAANPVAWLSLGLQPILRAATTNAVNAVNSLGVTIPSTTQVGDLLVLVVAQTHFSGTLFNAIAGWTKQGEQRAGGAADTIGVFTRIAQAGDAGATVTSTSVQTENYTGHVRDYANANLLSPMDVTAQFSSLDPAALTASAPAISPVSNNTTLLAAYSIPTTTNVQLTASDWTNNAGFGNEIASCTTSINNNAALVTYDYTTPSAGTFGPFSETVTDNRRWAMATLALRSNLPLLVDGFDDSTVNSQLWTNFTGTLSSGTLHLTTVSGYTSVLSKQTFDFTNRVSTIKAPVVPTATSGEMFLELVVDANNKVNMGKTGAALFTNYRTAGTDNIDTGTTYNATNHLWWRISFEGTNLKFYASADGTTWNLLRTVASGYPTMTSAQYVLTCGHYTGGDPDEPVEFDNASLI